MSQTHFADAQNAGELPRFGGSVGPQAVMPSSAGSLFQLLRDGQPRTRADLAAATGFARSTIAARVEELLEVGLIAPTGASTSTGGRPPATFAFNPETRAVLAVDVGVTHARVAVTDLTSRILVQRERELDITAGPATVLDIIAETAEGLLASVGRDVGELLGVGLGVPGPVEFETGRPTSPPIMPGWDGFDIPHYLRQRFPVPILVDNDVNVMALGEHAAAYSDVAHMMFVKVATGVGAGLISAGQIQRGAQGAAGDLGHIAVPDGDNSPCRCGNAGCLEAAASGPAIARKLRHRGFESIGHAELLALVAAGEPQALQAVRHAGRQIGSVLASCVNLLNPSVIVIGGSMALAGDQLLAGIREKVYSRSLPLATQHLRIVGTTTHGQAGVLGASALVTQQMLAAEQINALVG
ncbi:MAG: ROK family protein [Micrococcaceae bacterium]